VGLSVVLAVVPSGAVESVVSLVVEAVEVLDPLEPAVEVVLPTGAVVVVRLLLELFVGLVSAEELVVPGLEFVD
jgi:hypothetical protein